MRKETWPEHGKKLLIIRLGIKKTCEILRDSAFCQSLFCCTCVGEVLEKRGSSFSEPRREWFDYPVVATFSEKVSKHPRTL